MLIGHVLIKTAAAISFLCIALIASEATGESFEVRIVHASNDAIVSSKAQVLTLATMRGGSGSNVIRMKSSG